MGETMSIPSVIGPKSIKNHKQSDINYLDPKNSRSTKNELYQLYSQGKLIHIEKYTELEEQLNRLLTLTKEYTGQIREYKVNTEELKNKISILENKCKKYEEKIERKYLNEISNKDNDISERKYRDDKRESKSFQKQHSEKDKIDDEPLDEILLP